MLALLGAVCAVAILTISFAVFGAITENAPDMKVDPIEDEGLKNKNTNKKMRNNNKSKKLIQKANAPKAKKANVKPMSPIPITKNRNSESRSKPLNTSVKTFSRSNNVSSISKSR